MEELIAVVPARGGSKRLAGKNVKKLAGKPLIFHTLDALIGHDTISKIIFTTDEEEYIAIVKKQYGSKITCVKRPKAYGSDTTKVFDEMVRLAESGELDSTWFLLCLPTSPFRDFQTIQAVLDDWKINKESTFGATHYSFPVQFAFEIDDAGNWIPTAGADSPMVTGNTRSQDLATHYRPNGAFYLKRVDALFQHSTFYTDSKPFIMNETDSLDIDNEIDFLVVEQLWKMKSA